MCWGCCLWELMKGIVFLTVLTAVACAAITAAVFYGVFLVARAVYWFGSGELRYRRAGE